MKRHAPTLLFALPLLVALLSVAALSLVTVPEPVPLVTTLADADLAHWLGADWAHIDLTQKSPQRPQVTWSVLRALGAQVLRLLAARAQAGSASASGGLAVDG